MSYFYHQKKDKEIQQLNIRNMNAEFIWSPRSSNMSWSLICMSLLVFFTRTYTRATRTPYKEKMYKWTTIKLNSINSYIQSRNFINPDMLSNTHQCKDIANARGIQQDCGWTSCKSMDLLPSSMSCSSIRSSCILLKCSEKR